MTSVYRRTVLTAAGSLFAAAMMLGAGTATAQNLPVVKVGVLGFGTVQWEMKTIKRLGLDNANGIELEVIGYGGDDASAIALAAGEVDAIVSDYFFVSAQRAQGVGYTYVPHTNAVGGVVVKLSDNINSVEDLRGKTIAVSGGPVDQTFLMLRAWSLQNLGEDAVDAMNVVFPVVPQANLLLANGEAQGLMNLWHWNSRMLADSANYKQLISTAEIYAGLGIERVAPSLGWVFRESWADDNPASIRGFLGASIAAKGVLKNDDDAWVTLRPEMSPDAVQTDDNLFRTLRDQYRLGIPVSYDPNDISHAEQAFSILSDLGGEELVGESPVLAPGTFWSGFSWSRL